MRFALALAACLAACPLSAPAQKAPAATSRAGHYLFAWTGDAAKKGNDFLAVIDADPASPNYGHLVATLLTHQQTKLVHHTEYVMPRGGMFFASDYMAGRTFLFDVRDPLKPKIAATFLGVDGYADPHSYLRLPNGHVLSSFQHTRNPDPKIALHSGALVELDANGKFVRAASTADPALPHALLIPYSLVVLPKLDRVVSTNSAMDVRDGYGTTYQVWRLSDLKLLGTYFFDSGHDLYGQADPEEPRFAPDGSILVQTFSCGLQRITGVGTGHPRAALVWTFPGGGCGVPTIVGHYLIESDRLTHGLIVLDIANPAKPMEVARVPFPADYSPHWTGWDAMTHRLVVTANADSPSHRLYLLKFDPLTGAIAIDTAFHDADGKPGFNFDNRKWPLGPHGWFGSGAPHGVVFSRED